MTELKIFNAPAGSGKSTEIKDRVREWAVRFPHERMLCVTYTNRAADELKQGISAANVDVATIHSFLAGYMRPFFTSSAVVELYLETYRAAIEDRIVNIEKKEHIEASNERYVEKLGGPLTFELIAGSVASIRYSETPFNSLYSGALSHDDLLSFVGICAKRFPALYKRINSRYQQIVIDEYQDTSVDVLDFFVNAVEESDSSLHLYGDPMQQIYQLSSGRSRVLLEKFQADDRIITNYRSSSAIVSCLNQIYNDTSIRQEAASTSVSQAPRFHLTDTPADLAERLTEDDTLVLSVRNITIFENVGAGGLYKALQAMSDHGYGSRYPAVGVLTEPRWAEVKNSLLRLLFGFLQIEDLYSAGAYGSVIQVLRKNSTLFRFDHIEVHLDKARLRDELDELVALLRFESATVLEVVKGLVTLKHMTPADSEEYIADEEYAGRCHTLEATS